MQLCEYSDACNLKQPPFSHASSAKLQQRGSRRVPSPSLQLLHNNVPQFNYILHESRAAVDRETGPEREWRENFLNFPLRHNGERRRREQCVPRMRRLRENSFSKCAVYMPCQNFPSSLIGIFSKGLIRKIQS